jgi:hypothetical protein
VRLGGANGCRNPEPDMTAHGAAVAKSRPRAAARSPTRHARLTETQRLSVHRRLSPACTRRSPSTVTSASSQRGAHPILAGLFIASNNLVDTSEKAWLCFGSQRGAAIFAVSWPQRSRVG